jgi:hypothetical protein
LKYVAEASGIIKGIVAVHVLLMNAVGIHTNEAPHFVYVA